MFKVYFTNHQYYSSETFDSVDDAVKHGKSRGFNFRVDQMKNNVAHPICACLIYHIRFKTLLGEDRNE